MKKFLLFFFTAFLVLFISCEKDSLLDTQALENETKVSVRDIGNEFPPEVEAAINLGVPWVVEQQNDDGSFGSGGDLIAKTALAVAKLCDRSIEIGFTTKTGPFADAIAEGIDYIMEHAQIKTTDGLIFNSNGNTWHETYNSGIALMAIAAYRDPGGVVNVGNLAVDGKSYLQIAQKGVNFFVNSQNPDGGWRYFNTNEPSDQSNTGFVALGLLAAEKFGCEIPEGLKTNLSGYIDYTQNDDSGGCGYTDPNNWVNLLKTGNLLFEMAFVGDNCKTPRVLHAIQYIENNWNASSPEPGWYPDNYLAMYCMMKGFQTIGVDIITVDGEEISWYEAFWTELVADQNGDGSWPGAHWLESYTSTLFNLLTLEKITPVPYTEVCLDIKPTSCPNPFNMGANGVLPVAILGSEDFDVGNINIATLELEGIAPIRSDMEDVAAPVVDATEACECTTAGPDGYIDLTLKFNMQDIAAVLEDVSDGDVIELKITGELEDGTALVGKDCIWIKKKGKK